MKKYVTKWCEFVCLVVQDLTAVLDYSDQKFGPQFIIMALTKLQWNSAKKSRSTRLRQMYNFDRGLVEHGIVLKGNYHSELERIFSFRFEGLSGGGVMFL
mgnify:CR=1 FL=1